MVREQKPLRLPTKRNVRLKEHTESYLSHGFIATGDSHFPSLVCITCGDQLSSEARKPSKLLQYMENKHPALKDKPLKFFKRKKREHEEQKQLLKGYHLIRCVCTESTILTG